MYDLIVIGGGPAGAAAAITAARKGMRVLLLERGYYPRHKVCGEFVSSESVDLLANLLNTTNTSPAMIQKAIRIGHARLFSDDRILHANIVPPAASIARIELDSALWDSAERNGVEARQGFTVQNVRGRGPFQVDTADKKFEGRVVINASGRWSTLNSKTRSPHGMRWLGVKAHFCEPPASDSVDLYFFEGGYCGVQPLGLGQINVCAMVRADIASTLPEVLCLHAALHERSREWQRLSDPVSTSPLIFREPQPESNGVLMAGDAAGFIDPFVGDGISLALRSGSLAAQCLAPFLARQASLADAVREYRSAYQRFLLPIFRTSSKIRRLLELPGALRKPALFVLEKTPAISQYLLRRTR
jgi:menaquinone-9 beta-reductase